MMGDLPNLDSLPPSPLPENLLGYFDQFPEHLDHDTRVQIERLAEMMFAQGYISGHRRGYATAGAQAVRDRRRELMPATRVEGASTEVVRRGRTQPHPDANRQDPAK